MKIKRKILDQINNPRSRARICCQVGIGDRALLKSISKNIDNGPLTKMSYLLAISNEVGLPIEKLFEEEDGTNVQLELSEVNTTNR